MRAGQALLPLVDPAAVAAAFAAGVGAVLSGVTLGGTFDGRFTLAGAPGFAGGPGGVAGAHEGPYLGVSAEQSASLLLDAATNGGAVVMALSDGESIRERWSWGSPKRCCTLQIGGNITVCCVSHPVVLMTDDVFLGLGHDPKNFDAVVIKTP